MSKFKTLLSTRLDLLSQVLKRPSTVATVISKDGFPLVRFRQGQVDKEDQNDMRDELLDHVRPNGGKVPDIIRQTITEVHDIAESKVPPHGRRGRPLARIVGHLLVHHKRRDGHSGHVNATEGSESGRQGSLSRSNKE